MDLTVQLTDEDVVQLRDLLRISEIDFNKLMHGNTNVSSYAVRIMQVRVILGFHQNKAIDPTLT